MNSCVAQLRGAIVSQFCLLTIVTSTPSGAREATIMNIGIERNLSCVHIQTLVVTMLRQIISKQLMQAL
jgi:hypothetical protein